MSRIIKSHNGTIEKGPFRLLSSTLLGISKTVTPFTEYLLPVIYVLSHFIIRTALRGKSYAVAILRAKPFYLSKPTRLVRAAWNLSTGLNNYTH